MGLLYRIATYREMQHLMILKQDAEEALAVLAQQPEVDLNRITIIGHSEGTMIAPRIAIDSNNSNNTTATKVKNLGPWLQ